MNDRDDVPDDSSAERAAKGLVRGWIVAKTTPWLMRLTVWAMWIAAFAAYAGYVWWRVRRMLKAEERSPGGGYGLEVRSSSESQHPVRSPAPQETNGAPPRAARRQMTENTVADNRVEWLHRRRPRE